MANEQNLVKFQSAEEAREKGRNGGRKSGQVRREKRAIQTILNDFMCSPAANNPQLAKIAEKIGIKSTGSVKELFAVVSVLNTLKNCDLSDLQRLTQLLGEQPEPTTAEAKKQAAFLDAVKKAVSDED